MGGLTGFKQLKEKVMSYDANISSNDNYDDQYINEYTNGYYREDYCDRQITMHRNRQL